MACLCTFLSTKFKAFLSYFLPMVYGITLCSVAWLKVMSPIFVAVCLAFGSVDVITSIVGMIGILCPSELAIRSTFPLLALENLVTFLIAFALLIETIKYKEYTKDYMILDFSVGLTISFVLIISTSLSFLCIWAISDYQIDIEALNMVKEWKEVNFNKSSTVVNQPLLPRQSPPIKRSINLNSQSKNENDENSNNTVISILENSTNN
ncbi:uncharacterized protein CMU_031580 [Cryptosporidium muris RN66]|uniref:Uncharacterized protein n=1 Tax=Cryptosporidium muris (strain RN66) TaxID=441375 RepID=B6AIH6_CRYMR|nr:uncharacterized protein CMU_031580 [Cryptosporidium muris RN66]EEA08017.1 hypothetical protein, conserved [Cryptosporidium muris RN66]|eukprot:XP_002142366.1 hypothetical protein [Cryptosporidium muris RN66]